jgi:hypothetical protein
MPLDLTYPALLGLIKPAAGRTESHAFLLWFLQHFFRLDELDSQDTVCDGIDDKGVDGIYVDKNLEVVFVFQSKLVQNGDRTLGDTKLKEFDGTLSQFRDPARVLDIAATTANTELARLLVSANVAQLVEDGYEIRGVFVTNIAQDANAQAYMRGRDDLLVFDQTALLAEYVPVERVQPVGAPVTFDVFGYDCAEYAVGEAKVVVAPLKGNDLVRMDGVANNALFAWNVRGSLGRTKVNRDIERSVNSPSEHKNFLLYHNGLTVLCKQVERTPDSITVSGYSVVNGCQSLTSLYERRRSITDDLRVLTRLIELAPDNELAEKITHHSNNQNPINARDLQSNSTIQRRLQNEFASQYPDEVFYRIKRGEPSTAADVIDNDEAGRLLLAFDLKQPWTCHQSYKILDELHSDIFARPEVNARRIVAVADLQSSVLEGLGRLDNRLLASYRLTQYFLLYLLRTALEADQEGARFCADPTAFLLEVNGRERLRTCSQRIIEDLVIDLNAELLDREQAKNPFDYKRELKSPNAVRELQKSITPQYLKAVARSRATSFGEEWRNSKPGA